MKLSKLSLALLLSLAFLQPLLAQQAVAPSKWEKDISAFEASDKTNPPPQNAILFIGSSSIRMWRTLAKDFPDHKVFNRGFGGSQIIDSVEFADRIVFPYKPKKIFLYAGGNDIASGKSAEQVFADYKAFVTKVQERLPATHIAFIASAPNPARWAQVEKVKTLNQSVQQYTKEHKGLSFIDVYSHMLGADGLPRPEIFLPDRLHMNAKGYALWTSLVKPRLDE